MIYRYFLLISMVLYAIGFVWLLYTGEYSFWDKKVSVHLWAYFLFLSGLIFGGGAATPFRPKRSRLQLPEISQGTIRKSHKLINIIGLISCFFSIYYVVDGGYQKIQMLGSNIDSVDFRFLGLNDRSKLISVPMELSRRILLPFVILAKMSLNRFTHAKNRSMLHLFLLVFVIVSIINLDRGPIMMCIVLLAYQLFSVHRSLIYRVVVGSIAVMAITFTGALFTFLQYNNLDFQFQDLVDTLDNILIDRIILSPVRMAQHWVFDRWSLFAEPLYLKYSRIGVLVGREYIGSHESVSYLIAPVGIIGDIYRNLGTKGMFFLGLLLGWLFLLIEYRLRFIPPVFQMPVNFVTLILAMYLYYGNIFSLGPFAIIVFLIFVPHLVRIVSGRTGRGQIGALILRENKDTLRNFNQTRAY